MKAVIPTILSSLIVWLPAMAEALSAGSVLEELLNFDVNDFDADLRDALDSASESIRDAVKSTASLYRPSAGRLSLGSASVVLGMLGDRWIVEAHGAQLSPPSRVEVTDLALNMLYPSMEMQLSLGDLHLDGAFHSQGPALGPVQGRFTISLKNVKAHGQVGITMREDSLLMSAFDLMYEPSDITVNVTRSTGEVDVYPSGVLDASLTGLLLPRLAPLLDAQVRRTLGEALLEESIGERLGDDELAAAYLKHVERVEFLAAQALGKVLHGLPAGQGQLVLPEQKLQVSSGSEWVLTGPLALRGLRLAVDGPVSVAAPVPGQKRVLLFARLKVQPFQLEADWSGSVGGPHAGGLSGRCVGGALAVRLAAAPQAPLQVERADTVDLSVPQVVLPSAPEHPLPLLLTGGVSALLARSLAPALRESLAKGCR